MVGLVKQSLFKATGRATLTKQEREEILKGIEIVLNNRPLVYIKGVIQMAVLTPNALLYSNLKWSRKTDRWRYFRNIQDANAVSTSVKRKHGKGGKK